MAGFGYSVVPEGYEYTRQGWLDQLVALLDHLELDRIDVVGNSFGGSLALGLAIHEPRRVRRLVLMGSVGVPFEITQGLDGVWGYEPSVEEMGRLMRDTFAYDDSFITDDLVRMRDEASVRPGAQVHLFGRCGHWTRIEHVEAFARLVANHLGHDGLTPR